jgi:arsenite methyltransferase
MSTMSYEGDIGRIQRSLAQCHDMVVRRSAVLEALNLRTGERVLELGCGGGFYAYEAARAVGSHGRVCAIDISADQIAAARARCSEFGWVECVVADATTLPYDDASFDGAFATQVIEYIPRLDDALCEVQRVLRPGGRFINVATNWSSVVWHSNAADRMQRVLTAWRGHCPYPDLPATLAARLRLVGLQPLRQTTLPVLNMSYHENSFSFWAARLIHAFVVGQGAVPVDEADAWLQEFDDLEQAGEFLVCSTPILTEALKVA